MAGDVDKKPAQGDWVAEAADRAVAEAESRGAGTPLVCASGISPSGQPASFAEHIGKPLTSVPDPCGEHESWAEHFKVPFRAALAQLGVEVEEISQTAMYASGAYAEQIAHAMREHARIDAILARYRTAKTADEPIETETEDAPEEADDSSYSYYPFKPYCSVCGRDSTTITAFDDGTLVARYTCTCGHAGELRVTEGGTGKLVWKVDWPMRWAYEGVVFEAAGVDHSPPGSSFAVGSRLVREIFDGRPPAYLGYSFVGVSGQAKMSSSTGGAPTPGSALEILEPQLVRWLYGRRKPSQAITVAFDSEVNRLYDEWDALKRKALDGRAEPSEAATYERAAGPVTRTPLVETPLSLPFRTLASVADITTGDPNQMLRILRDVAEDRDLASLDVLRPRLDRAEAWVERYLPNEDRTHVLPEPDKAHLSRLTPAEQKALDLLLDGLADAWSLPGLTALLYGIPKTQAGLPQDASPTPELKAAQRRLFVLVYELLLGRNTGPRLPTLLLSLGQPRIRRLLDYRDAGVGLPALTESES
jgi:lysyl-tRNA synthetase class 1